MIDHVEHVERSVSTIIIKNTVADVLPESSLRYNHQHRL